MSNIYAYSANDINGETVNLDRYRNQVVLIVNTASQCGFTPQYQGLQTLYQAYQVRGFVVLGFPCNQFGGQEPGTHQQIGQYCRSNYGVSFPLFEKIAVNGTNTHPLYQYLKNAAPGCFGSRAIKWNFTKFLVQRNGEVAARCGSLISPLQLCSKIERLL
ncbi:glutathione peroxidase [Methylomonas paludis]|uniref:Glutathione peroxidase n=1 Tax=Methylomonas paludis TaxID=1173101 RepID=A0A975MLV6_9GAMM|nr:glutathione peroxidase [Methylomonas paludis]QWF70210.1 glutathione peroxidase [Methylomonas paludis]